MPLDTPFDTPGFGAGDGFVGATLGVGAAGPLARSVDVKGGTKQVANVAARDAIAGAALPADDPAQMRQEGMFCAVKDRGDGSPETYQLIGGLGNGFWVVFSSGGGGGNPTLSGINNTGSLIPQGSLVARSATVGAQSPLDIALADATDISLNVSNVFAVVTEGGGIADAASGELTTREAVSVLFVAGLTLAPGDEVLLSATPGSATNLPASTNGIPSGGSIQKIGTLLHPITYDGAADLLALVLFDPDQRRQAV